MISIVKSMIFRNKKDLNGTPVQNGVVLERWKRLENAGDYISSVIFDWMLDRENLEAEKGKNVHLFAVGSILGFSKADGVIWGSGILDAYNIRNIMRRKYYIKYDVRALRGPITKSLMMAAGYKCRNAVLGDPGILLPLIYQKEKCEKKYKYCIINHLYNAENNIDDSDDTLTISAGTNDYKWVIDRICEAEIVISSSLHGIILAEAYGVPAVWLLENMEDRAMKYYDYYYSTGRFNIPVARNVQEAKQIEPVSLPLNLEAMQRGLIAAFPYDLWK